MNKENVGEVFIIGFRGSTIPSWVKKFTETYGLGGIILFDYNCQSKTYDNNIESYEQTQRLCSEIHELPSRPLVFVDQEGGKVRRLKEKKGFAPLPSAQSFNHLPILEKQELLRQSFAELRHLGFHYNLAPVIDLNTNPSNPDIGAVERSYSSNPQEVRENFKVINSIAKEVNLGLSLKHYPGLGGATVNSHEELTDLTGTLSQAQLDLFYDLGKEVSGKSMIVSHGIVQDWEKDMPISLSKIAIDRLRKEVPDVLLISDDMQMQGLQKLYSTREGALLGLQAGLDLICIGNNLIAEDENIFECAKLVQAQIEQNESFQIQFEQKLSRVELAKRQF